MHAFPECDRSCLVICDFPVRACAASARGRERAAKSLGMKTPKYQRWFLYNQLGDVFSCYSIVRHSSAPDPFHTSEVGPGSAVMLGKICFLTYRCSLGCSI